jgi:hypothetical protein
MTHSTAEDRERLRAEILEVGRPHKLLDNLSAVRSGCQFGPAARRGSQLSPVEG